MARGFRLFFVLCLVTACLGNTTLTDSTATPTVTTNVVASTSTNNDTSTNSTATPTVTTNVVASTSTNNDTSTNSTATPTVTTTAVTSLTTAEPDPCEFNPCATGSTCEPRFNETFVCLCLPGDFYDVSKSCVRAKVFPGQLQLTNLTYSAEMKNKKSKEFLEASESIISALDEVFRNSSHHSDYSGSTVLELRNGANSNHQLRSENPDPVIATVEIIFSADSDITAADVQDTLKNASDCGTCFLNGTSFSSENLCDRSPCDEETTTCFPEDGSYSCNCTENYVEIKYSNRICMACPSGQKAEGTSTCVDCPFGYSGFNCNESWQLDLVIVGTVLGGLLLITIILLPVVARKSSKKRSKKNKDTGELHFNLSPAKAPLVNSSTSQPNSIHGSANAFADAGVPKIPRVAATSNWNRTGPESSQGYSRQNPGPMRLYEDQDDMAPYAQSLPQNKRYAQKQPQFNPYASRQGQSNPYYEPDD